MKNFTLVEIKYDASNFQDCNVFLTGKELTARKIALQTLKTHTEHTGYSYPVFALCLCYMEENKVSGLKLLYLGTFKFVIIASLSIFNFYFYLFRQGGAGYACAMEYMDVRGNSQKSVSLVIMWVPRIALRSSDSVTSALCNTKPSCQPHRLVFIFTFSSVLECFCRSQ